MKMTKCDNYEKLSDKEKNKVNISWIRANLPNINVNIYGDTVVASDKDTGEEIISAICNEDSISVDSIKSLLGEKEDLYADLVGNIGDIMWCVDPRFEHDEDDVCNTRMYLDKSAIKQVKIYGIMGSNDTPICLRGKDLNNDLHLIMQYAFFDNLEDALKACESTPSNGFTDWNAYIEANRNIIKHKYRIVTDFKKGDDIELHNSIGDTTAKVSRMIIDISSNNSKVSIQTAGNLCYCVDGRCSFVDNIDREVKVTCDKYSIPELEYNGTKLVDIICYDCVDKAYRIEEIKSLK